MFAFWSYWGPGTAGGVEFAWVQACAVSSTVVILHVEVADDGKVEVEVAPCDMSTLHCIPLCQALRRKRPWMHLENVVHMEYHR